MDAAQILKYTTALITGITAPELRDGKSLPTTSSGVTATGRLAGLIMAEARGTGAGPMITLVYIPAAAAGAIELIQGWIDEDGTALSESFHQDLAELQSSRISLRRP